MARSTSSQGHRSHRLSSLVHGERPQGIRKSIRLQKRYTPKQVHKSLIAHDSNDQPAQLPPVTTTQPTAPKRKRSREIDTSNQPVQKRQRQASTLLDDERIKVRIYTAKDAPTNLDTHKEPASDDTDNPVCYWAKHQQWPHNFFKMEGNMNHLLAKKKLTSTLRRKSLASSINSSNTSLAPSDQKLREAKDFAYARKNYETLLATKGSFMDDLDEGITKSSSDVCQTLISSQQTNPQDTLFRNDLFKKTCRKIRGRNEAMVVQHIMPLIVPSPQVLEIYGAVNLNHLVESVNEGWNSAIPFYGPRPQPDYSVGFERSAFTDDQLKRLEPFVGEVTNDFTSYFMATSQMHFPFLTCEVKCGATSLDIVDRQNAHSMTLAVRAVVELFRLVKREQEIDHEILAFSVSHDYRMVRIYGHYPVIDGKDTKYYRHLIRAFDFTEQEGKEKWTAYKFTKNVYDNWMPDHLGRICSAIDDIPPDLSFDVSQEPELQLSSQTGLSQELENYHPSQSKSLTSVASWDSVADVRHTTPNTSAFERNTPSIGAAHTSLMPPPGPQKRARQDGGAESRHIQSLESEVAHLRERKRLIEKQQKEEALRKELEELQEWERSLATE